MPGPSKNYTEYMNSSDSQDMKERLATKYEYYSKFAMPMACLLFFLIGAPLGAIIRKGGMGMPVVISIFFFIIFYTLRAQGQKLAREGVIYAWYGAWMPIIFIAPFALFVTYQSARDSQLFDATAWFLLRDEAKKKD